MEHGILLPQRMGSKPLTFLHNLGGAYRRPDLNTKMNMLRLNRQLDNLPSLLLTFLPEQSFTVLCHRPGKHGLTALRTPDQVIDNEMDAVLVALVCHM